MPNRMWSALRLILPAVWLGLIIGIDLIEAPLKFQAPGITIPLGLGIGRLVFLAMNFTELAIAIVLIVALWRSRADRPSWWLAISIVIVFAAKFTIIRPLLGRHTNEVLAGGEGGSLTHYVYIAADAVLFVLLVWFLISQARRLIRTIAPATPNSVEGSQ